MNHLAGINQLTDYQTRLQALQPTKMHANEGITATNGTKFSDVLSQAVDNLNANNAVVNQDTQNIISGKEKDLGSVMTRMTEAQLTLQTAVQIRNKALETYNDLKNMQF